MNYTLFSLTSHARHSFDLFLPEITSDSGEKTDVFNRFYRDLGDKLYRSLERAADDGSTSLLSAKSTVIFQGEDGIEVRVALAYSEKRRGEKVARRKAAITHFWRRRTAGGEFYIARARKKLTNKKKPSQ